MATANPVEAETQHVVDGHRDKEGRWHLECETDGWTIDTDPGVTEDEVDALIDAHLAT